MSPWRTTTVGDEIELLYGKPLPAEKREPGEYDVYGSNGIVGHHSKSVVEGPGIIIGRKGSVGEIAFSEKSFWPIDTTYYVINKGNHDWRFLYHLLRNLGLTGLNSHSTIPGLGRDNVLSILLDFPDLAEQRNIAAHLDLVEKKLILEVFALQQTFSLKRAVMRELFTRGLRGEAQRETEIGLIPENWEITTLGRVAELSTGTTPATKHPEYFKGTIPFIKTTDIINNRIVSSTIFVSEQAIADYSLEVYKPGTVLMAMYGQGKTRGQVSILDIPASTTQNAAAIEPNDSLDSSYLWHYLMGSYERLRGMGSLGHISHLNLGYLRELAIPLPSLPEQREIVEILDAIDRKIELHKKKKALLEELFTSLLHKLMTGEIRVEELDLSAIENEWKEPQRPEGPKGRHI
jgi:type I restriction enzyme S subunit